MCYELWFDCFTKIDSILVPGIENINSNPVQFGMWLFNFLSTVCLLFSLIKIKLYHAAGWISAFLNKGKNAFRKLLNGFNIFHRWLCRIIVFKMFTPQNWACTSSHSRDHLHRWWVELHTNLHCGSFAKPYNMPCPLWMWFRLSAMQRRTGKPYYLCGGW